MGRGKEGALKGKMEGNKDEKWVRIGGKTGIMAVEND